MPLLQYYNILPLSLSVLYSFSWFWYSLYLEFQKTKSCSYIHLHQSYRIIFCTLFFWSIFFLRHQGCHKFEVCSYSMSYYPDDQLIASPLENNSLPIRSMLIILKKFNAVSQNFYFFVLMVIIQIVLPIICCFWTILISFMAMSSLLNRILTVAVEVTMIRKV